MIGEGRLCAVGGEGGRAPPGDGMIVRDAHDEAALARHQPAGLRNRALNHSSPCTLPEWSAQASIRWNTSEALVPPNPKLFDMTVASAALSMRLRTMGASDNSGSISSIFADSAMNPFRICKME